MKQLLLSLIEQLRDSGITYREGITQFKIQWITCSLVANRFNQVATARELGMHRNTLSRTLEELGINARALENQWAEDHARTRKPVIRAAETAMQVAGTVTVKAG